MIHFTFNSELQILETQFKNDIYLNDIIEYINAIKENDVLPRTLKILTDAEDANFEFTHKDLDDINSAKTEALKKYNYTADALIINSSETAALSVLYQGISKSGNYNFGVFSTKEAALKWLENF